MSKLQVSGEILRERFTTGALEIFGAVEKQFAEYEEEIYHTAKQSVRLQRLLDIVTQPDRNLHPTDVQQFSVLEPSQVKEEDELWTNQEEYQLQGLQSEFSYVKISKLQEFKDFQNEILTKAASEIFRIIEKMFGDYREEICRTREESARLQRSLDIVTQPEIKLYRADLQQFSLQDPPQIKEEQGQRTNPEKELQSNPSDSIFTSHSVKQHSHMDSSELPHLYPTVKVESSEDESLLTNTTEEQIKAEVDEKDIGALKAATVSTPRSPVTLDCPTAQNSEEETEGRLPVLQQTRECKVPNDAQPKNNNRSSIVKSHKPYRHVKSHTGEETHQCHKCNKVFNQKCDMENHMRRHTGKKLHQCQECNKCFSHKTTLVRHTRLHTGEKPHQCQECSKSFCQIGSLLSHMRTHTGERPYQCQECKNTFSEKSHLIQHMRRHTGEKPHQCQECDKCFRHKTTLVRHMLLHTGEKPYQCQECNKSFSQMGSLVSHIRTHTGEKPRQCEQCNKSFSQMSTLVNHMRTHTGEKPYQCQECKQSFSQKTNLIHHMRKHTGEKPHQCQECNKSFSYMGSLVYHMRTHTGEKSHQCQECDKSFRHKSTLARHMRLHTGEKPHQCQECKTLFR